MLVSEKRRRLLVLENCNICVLSIYNKLPQMLVLVSLEYLDIDLMVLLTLSIISQVLKGPLRDLYMDLDIKQPLMENMDGPYFFLLY